MTAALKKQKLRNIEYYNIQTMFDELYSKSERGENFYDLVEMITTRENILLAFRNIKKNKGSKTSGSNKRTILDVAEKDTEALIHYVKDRLANFHPHPVKRKYITKENGGSRPLGIPTIEDRLLQQCILQVLEPICESKFHKHSYGFRPLRSQHHAMARVHHLVNNNQLHYVVDIDIKGFFDNVSHSKLKKQLWTMGIRDKNLLCILGKMLRAEIKGEGTPTQGTPQGGIISPLLSNVVLNELDWWISSQWETFETQKAYLHPKGIQTNRFRAQKTTRLKECYIVRYADDFKIFCRNYKDAQKMFIATKNWLKERLGLDISPEKSKVVNLRKNYSEFLGFKFKARAKRTHRGGTHVIGSHMSDKATRKAKKNLQDVIQKVSKHPSHKNVQYMNSVILGIQNYYKIATFISQDLKEIAFSTSRTMYNGLKHVGKREKVKQGKYLTYEKLYPKHNGRLWTINGRALFPIYHVQCHNPMNLSPETSPYTETGRAKVHTRQKAVSPSMINYLMRNPIQGQSVEYNDNRISLYVGQCGLCHVTKQELTIGNMECHHIVPKSRGGSDKYNNLVFITRDVHKLIHATKNETINNYLLRLKLSKGELSYVNKLRKSAGNYEIGVSNVA